ncbi:DUF2586 domain-containing protein [Mannheimia sp. E30BD]|uniref:DUF2586 domain-containing protein n=1 Tax=Mannheimia sp. E30BD TaxID=3278708 RepID=UPI00359E6940
MAFPGVQINALNQLSGTTKEIERTALFVGVGSKNLNQLTAVTADTDLNQLFGSAETELKKQVKTAMLNAGQNWFAYVYQTAEEGYDFVQAVKNANNVASFEYCINTNTFGIDKAAVNKLQECHSELLAVLGRRTFFIQSIASINNESDGGETWGQYVQKLTTLTKTIAADHVMLVPNLFGTDTGALAGRLANRAVTVADSPCRVKTGAVVGLNAEKPKDKDGAELDIATLKALDLARYSTVMWYPDYEGYYWADGRTLDVEGGDYQVIENVRVVDKAARRIRLQAISKIGDRSLNASLGSIEAHKTFFTAVLREMSKSAAIGNVDFPGECYPPKDGDVDIVWTNKNAVTIYVKVRPLECPKSITVSIFLDLTTLGGGDE